LNVVAECNVERWFVFVSDVLIAAVVAVLAIVVVLICTILIVCVKRSFTPLFVSVFSQPYTTCLPKLLYLSWCSACLWFFK